MLHVKNMEQIEPAFASAGAALWPGSGCTGAAPTVCDGAGTEHTRYSVQIKV